MRFQWSGNRRCWRNGWPHIGGRLVKPGAVTLARSSSLNFGPRSNELSEARDSIPAYFTNAGERTGRLGVRCERYLGPHHGRPHHEALEILTELLRQQTARTDGDVGECLEHGSVERCERDPLADRQLHEQRVVNGHIGIAGADEGALPERTAGH